MTTTTSNLPRATGCAGGAAQLLAVAVSALLLAACSGNSSRPADPPARAGDLYQVDGETAHLQCQGAGSPTLVFLGWHGLHDDDLGGPPRRPGTRRPNLRLGLPRRGPLHGRADDDRRDGPHPRSTARCAPPTCRGR